MKKVILSTIAVLALSGCAVQKNWAGSGGSKSDGIVKMSYTYGYMEAPKTDAAQGLKKAVARCKNWGYQSAVAFEFVNKKCNVFSVQYGCTEHVVTQEYQCE